MESSLIVTSSLIFFGVLAFLAGMSGGAATARTNSNTHHFPHPILHHRGTAMVKPNRIWGDKCSKADIEISQGPATPLPRGIPSYTVEITNTCVNGCNISRIHLACGWFSSARLINPKVFKRLRYNYCLVNDGKPLPCGAVISFQYATTFPYPLSLSSALCICPHNN